MIKIYGKNCINEAIRCDKSNILEVFIADNIAKKEDKFIAMLKDKGIKYKIMSKFNMEKEFGYNTQGYAAYRKDYEIYELEDLLLHKKSMRRFVILDGIQDPHNFGAILRSCDAFGVDAVLLPKSRSVSITSTVSHVSTGAIEYTKICYVNSLSKAILKLKNSGFWIVGTDAHGDKGPNDIDKSLDLAIIIGSEGFGMSKSVNKEVDFLLSIPMVGHVNSLNASVSAGIVIHSLSR